MKEKRENHFVKDQLRTEGKGMTIYEKEVQRGLESFAAWRECCSRGPCDKEEKENVENEKGRVEGNKEER